ncbi:MAG: type IV toxin-antitoxin system AbiEi family antitoxin domain-containing protein, partial [Prevotella sp.]|nr:type IV toxin-antitoxin system AbiEi family antitoxin domain-containing protein [Prevotella sp.]
MLICDKIISIKVKSGAMLMAYENMLIDLAKQNNGIITAKMATEAGILNGSIKYLVDNGKLERVARGVFVLPDAWEDEFVTWQSKYKRGIYSLDTALFLLDLTDRTPGKFNMTFPSKYNVSNPKKDGIICNSLKFDIYN